MRIRIIGGGSIGLLLAGRLAGSGTAQIELITRTQEQAERVREQGIAVKEAGGGLLRAQVSASSLENMPDCAEPVDWLFLAVKQQAIDDKLMLGLQKSAPPTKGMLCWQNGIGHLELLAQSGFGAVSGLYAAVTTEGARRLEPTVVAHTGAGMTAIGKVAAASGLSAAEAADEKMLADTLVSAGFAAAVSKHIVTDIWNKLLVNAAINPLTAILHVPNGELLRSESAGALIKQLASEALLVARAEGAVPDEDIVSRIVQVCRGTASNRSSMLQDLDRGRTTENEWISGSIVRLAACRNLPVPVTETVYRLVQALEKRG